MPEVRKKQGKQKDELSPQEENFVQGVLSGLSNTEAYKRAFPDTKMCDRDICSRASHMINGTGNFSPPKDRVRTRYNFLCEKAKKMADKNVEKKIVNLYETLSIMSAIFRDPKTKNRDKIRLGEIFCKMFGVFKEQGEINNQEPLVIIDDA